jgi:light-regulated signal transduction histidine kinase (bacteriophytochrome)
MNDITARKAAERAAADNLKHLVSSNKELEQFAYVASHDLQEPLRMVASYTQLLARRYRGKLDADADEFIAFAVEGVTRMQSLINDLLIYARIGSHADDVVQADSGAALDRALANLKTTIADTGAAISRTAMPVVRADPTQLDQLFQNLLSNALKFRRDERPEVAVGAEALGDLWHFSVRDNGIGIDPSYFDRIFVIFQRLHNRDKYEGTGIGLSICKKIVERHGGTMWVESRPGSGSTFHFTLPAGGPS